MPMRKRPTPLVFRSLACLVTATGFLSSGSALAISCSSGSGASSECQHIVSSNEVAPAPSLSMGLRHNGGVLSVLYDNRPSYDICRYADNTSTNDYFVPQGSASDFSSFINYAPAGMTISFCVLPTSITATPSEAAAYQLFSEAGAIQNPTGTVAPIPGVPVPTVNAVTRFVSEKTTTKMTVGAGGVPLSFLYVRDDCRKVGYCNQWYIREDQTITMTSSITGGSGNSLVYVWGSPVVTSLWYMSGSVSGPWTNIAGPNRNYSPPAAPIDGVCGSDNGASLSSTPTNLCSSGTPSGLSGSGPWSWSCLGANTGTSATCSAAYTPPPPTIPYGKYSITGIAANFLGIVFMEALFVDGSGIMHDTMTIGGAAWDGPNTIHYYDYRTFNCNAGACNNIANTGAAEISPPGFPADNVGVSTNNFCNTPPPFIQYIGGQTYLMPECTANGAWAYTVHVTNAEAVCSLISPSDMYPVIGYYLSRSDGHPKVAGRLGGCNASGYGDYPYWTNYWP